MMKIIIYLLFLIISSSCLISNSFAKVSLEVLLSECEQKKDSFACANAGKYAMSVNKKKEAAWLFSKACELNHYVSCVNAGVILEQVGDKTQALKAYAHACKNNVNYGCHLAGEKLLEKNDFKNARFVFSSLCEKEKFDKSCNSLKILNEREKLVSAEAEKKLKDQEYLNTQISACNNGDSNICWGLYLANKGNEFGYGHLRNACILNHPNACHAKQVLDQEKSDAIQRDVANAVIKESAFRQEIIQKQVNSEIQQREYDDKRCTSENQSFSSSCNETCPGYQYCLENKRNNPLRRAIEYNNRSRRTISCTTNGSGGYLRTNCTEN